MKPPEVTFIEAGHQYLFDGQPIPGLSYILATCGFINHNGIRKDVLEAAKVRGDAAHYACRLYDEDNPSNVGHIEDWEQCLTEPLDPWTRSRLTGWIKFRKEFQFRPMIIEKAMSHCWAGMLFGMTPDRYGETVMGNAVFEIKCTAEIEPAHALQTAFQVQPFKIEGQKIERFAVQLLENDYRIVKFEDRQEERIALAALAIVHYRWQKGIK